MKRTETRRSLGLAVAVAATLLIVIPPAGASSSSSAGLAAGDFDGDGIEDLAVGAPEEDVGPPAGPEVSNAGAVHVIYGTAKGLKANGDQYLHQDVSGAIDNAEASDRFGNALAAGDLDGDGFDDLAVGVIGEDGNTGGVHLFFGSSTGITMNGNRILTQGAGPDGLGDSIETSDGFAHALVIGNFGKTGVDDLIVGAPFENVGPDTDGGIAHVVYGGPGGPDATTAKVLHQDLPNVRSSIEPFDSFGISLAARDFGRGRRDDLAIGVQSEKVPNADEEDITSAGAVNVFYGSTGGLRTKGSQYLHQDTPGVPDTLESDGFGAAVTGGNFGRSAHGDLAIGAPFETVNGASGGGAAFVLYGSDRGLVGKGSQMWHADKGEVAGNAEDTDYLGRSMTAGDLGRSVHDDLVVGAPHDTFGDSTFASGTALVLYGSDSGLRAKGSQEWDQTRSGMESEPDTDEFFARGLVTGDFGKTGRDEVVFGVPGDSVDSTFGAGAAHVLYGRDGALSTLGVQYWHQDVTGIEDEVELGDHFGDGPNV